MKLHPGIKTFLLGLMLLPVTALAQPVLQERCSLDSLDISQARERVEWARTCGLIRNVGSDTSKRFVANQEDVNEAGVSPLYDYKEGPTDTNTYSGTSYGQTVNEAYLDSLYVNTGIIQQQTDSRGYYRWYKSTTKLKPQPLYPTFGSTSSLYDPANKQLYRNPYNSADCTLYSNPGATTPAPSFYVIGYCVASCYTPEQQLLFSDGYAPILDALNARREDLVTLSPDATLDSPSLQVNRTYSYVAEIRDSSHLIYDIRTSSGGLLRVTADHGVLRSEGRMVQAHTLKPGQELLKADGTPDSITSVSTSQHFGKVYNLRPVSQDLVSNVVVAQGFLVGSSQYQNDLVGYINRLILYKRVPHEVIP